MDPLVDSRSGRTKDYTIDISCFAVEHAALRGENKDCLVFSQYTESDWDDMYMYGTDCCVSELAP